MNDLSEDIKILEECIDKMIKDERIHDDYRNTITAIENLVKGYRELEEENQKLIYELQDKDDEIRFANRDIKVFETDFIPKSKIKEKIEPVIDSLEKNGFVGYADELSDIVSELMEDK